MKSVALFSLAVAAFASTAMVSSARAAEDGLALYGANCGICHQGGAVGVPGQFPMLKGRISTIASTAQGKTYITHVLLNGLTGPIQAGGDSIAGYMPSFKSLPDEQIAAILTYVASLGDAKPAPVFTAADIKAGRATPLATSAVLQERTTLNAAHPIP